MQGLMMQRLRKASLAWDKLIVCSNSGPSAFAGTSQDSPESRCNFLNDTGFPFFKYGPYLCD